MLAKTNTLVFWLMLLGSMFCSHSALAQEPYFIHYGVADGLPSPNTYSTFRDPTGYIWVATDNGVARFDGYDFEHFSVSDGLTDNEIFSFFQDSNEQIWLSNYNGPLVFWKDGAFHPVASKAFLDSLKVPSYINSFAEDEEGNILFSNYRDGLILLKTDGSVLRCDVPVCFAVWRSEGRWCFVSKFGIYSLNDSLDDKQLLYPFDWEKFIVRANFTNGTLVLGVKNKVLVFKHGKRQELHLPEAASINFITIDTTGSEPLIWCGTSTGVYRLSLRELRIQSHFLEKEAISSILVEENTMWISSLDNGIFYVPSKHVQRYLPEGHPSDQQIWSLHKTGNDLLFGNGRDKLTTWEINGLAPTQPETFTGRITNINRFDSNTSVVMGKTFIRLQREGEKPRYHPNWANDLKLHKGRVFIAGNFLTLIDSSTFSSFLTDQPRPSPPVYLDLITKNRYLKGRIERLYIDQSDRMWICANQGLYFWDEEKTTFEQLPLPELSVPIADIIHDQEANLYLVATKFEGVYQLQDGKIVKRFDASNGLSSSSVNRIVLGPDGDYYIGTQAGLDRVSIQPNVGVRPLNFTSGYVRAKVNDILFSQDTIFLASDNGLIYFNYASPLTTSEPLNLVLEKVKVDGVELKSIGSPELMFHNNSISFEYTGLSYGPSKNIFYQYRVLGRDSSWSQTQNREVAYAFLGPGDYTFQCRGVDGSGNRSPVLNYPFSIPRPFWLSWWFWSLIGAFVLVSGTIFIVWRLRQLRKENRLETELLLQQNEMIEMEKLQVELEQKARQLQLNPHFIFNSLNTIKGYYSNNNIEKANAYIGRFSKILRLIVDEEGTTISLNREVEFLDLYLTLLQSRYPNFEYTINVDSRLESKAIRIPLMLLQPFVENAVIHGLAPVEHGKLWIEINQQDDQTICCEIRDSGVGRAVTREKNARYLSNRVSRATQITLDRLELLSTRSGRLYQMTTIDEMDENERSAGTRVIFEMPLVSDV